MHVHSVHPSFLQKFVANGVTGIRDMGGGAADATDGCESVKIEVLLRWRDGIRSGDLVGPRMYLSGPAVSNTNWPGSINIKTPAEARDAVARLKAIGADFIKVYEKIPLDAYLELARAAGSADLHIAGHVPVDTVGLIQASNAGHRSVEHIRDHLLMSFTKSRSELLKFFRDDKWEGPDVAWGMDNFKACPAAIKTFRRNQTWLVPTLVVERAKVAVNDPEFVESRQRQLMPEAVRRGFVDYVAKKRAQSHAERASEQLWWEKQLLLVGRMRGEQVGILAGTDSSCEGGIPGISLHEELKLMVAAGLSPLEALQTATINPAKYLRQESEFGTLRNGRAADIVLLNANPLERIDRTSDIYAVVADGRYFSRSQLDRLMVSGH